VPLAEAASLGVPVVATDQAAVAETLGERALVLRDASDDVVAVAIHRVLHDAALRDALVRAQKERFAERYANAAVERRFLAAVEPLLAGGEPV
jgi:glycosyltransferase involved in cell wall biosynthesis